MIEDELRRLLRFVLCRDLLLDLEDRIRAEALKAFTLVRDHSGLRRPREARGLEGQARFRMTQQGFEEVCELHGGSSLVGGMLPKTELQVFQPFMRFKAGEQGVILGLASMPEPRAMPVKNKSRLAGVTLNYHLQPSLDFYGNGAKIGDVFALLLTSRDRETLGMLGEIAIGIIDSGYSTFLFYEPIEKFLSGEVAPPSMDPPADPSKTPKSRVTLKRNVKPFVPPEAPARKGGDEGEGKA